MKIMGSFCLSCQTPTLWADTAWLRAATSSLARLWQSQGKREEAYDLLAPVYEWFTEGCDPFSRNLEQFKGRRGKGGRGL